MILGSPPRGWGKQRVGRGGIGGFSVHPHAGGENYEDLVQPSALTRFTPTRVGKTLRRQRNGFGNRGSPPRGWGKLAQPLSPVPDAGSPPRGWGKRFCHTFGRFCTPVHPHAGGENRAFGPSIQCPAGSPPRGWGKRSFVIVMDGLLGSPPRGWGKRCYELVP